MSVENQNTDATESRDKLREGFFTRTLVKLNFHSGPQKQKKHIFCLLQAPARNQILEMNAFQPDSMTFERKDSLVQHLLNRRNLFVHL